jgi:hypothetical protein
MVIKNEGGWIFMFENSSCLAKSARIRDDLSCKWQYTSFVVFTKWISMKKERKEGGKNFSLIHFAIIRKQLSHAMLTLVQKIFGFSEIKWILSTRVGEFLKATLAFAGCLQWAFYSN